MSTYRIHRFSKLTGLSPHVIRAWEKRYDLVSPTRGKNRYRQYTDEDVRFFRYLKGETDKGKPIGSLVEQGREELLARSKVAYVESNRVEPVAESLVAELVEAISSYDLNFFERKINGALAVIPFEDALQRFLFPLLEQVGDLWHKGTISVAQEHYVSNLVKQKIISAMNQLRIVEYGPKVVVACPQEEVHELGALTVAHLCAARGCRIYYLGLGLPIEELAEYCSAVGSSLMLFSLTAGVSDEVAENLAHALATEIIPLCSVGIGGQGAIVHASRFEKEKITVYRNIQELEIHLLSVAGG